MEQEPEQPEQEAVEVVEVNEAEEVKEVPEVKEVKEVKARPKREPRKAKPSPVIVPPREAPAPDANFWRDMLRTKRQLDREETRVRYANLVTF